jgi:hypothetical protein
MHLTRRSFLKVQAEELQPYLERFFHTEQPMAELQPCILQGFPLILILGIIPSSFVAGNRYASCDLSTVWGDPTPSRVPLDYGR